MNIGFQHKLDRFPPVVCRLFARHRWGLPLDNRELAERSGLSEYKVVSMSTLTSWDSVTVGDMRAFLRGCGLDFDRRESMNRIGCYLRSKAHSKFVHLRRSPHRDYFAELARIAMEFIAQNWRK